MFEAVLVHGFAVVAFVGNKDVRHAVLEQCHDIAHVVRGQHADACCEHLLATRVDENARLDWNAARPFAVNAAQVVIAWLVAFEERAIDCSHVHVRAARGSKRALPQRARHALCHLGKRRICGCFNAKINKNAARPSITPAEYGSHDQREQVLPQRVYFWSVMMKLPRQLQSPQQTLNFLY